MSRPDVPVPFVPQVSRSKQSLLQKEADEALLPFVLASGMRGVPLAAVVAWSGQSKGGIENRMRRLKVRGLIEPSHPKGGSVNRWGPVGIRADWLKTAGGKRSLKAVARKTTQEQRTEFRQKAKRQIEKRLNAERFEQPPVHRIVPALEAAPIGRVGPCSVWDLAA